jgi:2-methylcitrate dehydratase PrpD
MPCIIKVYMKDGLFVEATADLPCGHPEMPLSDADLESKFFALAQQSITFEQAQMLLTSLWGVNSAESTRDLFNHCHVN